MIDGSGAKFLTDFGYVSRMLMVAKMQRHGFSTSFAQRGDGVMIMAISGMWHGGSLEVVVPSYPLDNHAQALQDVYLVMGLSLSDVYGWFGNC